jgi:uncharacterized membrane protein YfcA
VSAGELALATAIVAIGSCIQGAVGMGLGLFSAPLLVMIDRELVPGPIIFVAFFLTLAVSRLERRDMDLSGLGWVLLGRLPGIALGALAVAALSDGLLTIVFACCVLVAVVVSVSGWRLRPTTPALLTVGAVSGVMGTASSIGGPPVALLYQYSPGAQLRANLAAYFVVGSAMSLVGLALFGEFGIDEVAMGAALLPGAALGLLVSRRAAWVLDRGYTRRAVLAVSAASSVVLLVRELV